MMSSINAILVVSLLIMATTNAVPAYEQASDEVSTLLQQGKDQSACADLAKSLADEVSSNVDTANKQLASLDDGADCKDQGQGPLAEVQTAKEEADKAAGAAATAAADAAGAEVDFGTFSFASLNEDICTQFWEDENYVAAKNAKEQADKASLEAKATANAMDKSLDEAKTAASNAKQSCLCGVRKAYNAAWAAATASKDEQAAAWAKAKNMECVLAGTAASECQFGQAPAISPKTLADDVPQEECSAEPTPPPTPTPTCPISCRMEIYDRYGEILLDGIFHTRSQTPINLTNTQRENFASFSLSTGCKQVTLYKHNTEPLGSSYESKDGAIQTIPRDGALVYVMSLSAGC